MTTGKEVIYPSYQGLWYVPSSREGYAEHLYWGAECSHAWASTAKPTRGYLGDSKKSWDEESSHDDTEEGLFGAKGTKLLLPMEFMV